MAGRSRPSCLWERTVPDTSGQPGGEVGAAGYGLSVAVPCGKLVACAGRHLDEWSRALSAVIPDRFVPIHPLRCAGVAPAGSMLQPPIRRAGRVGLRTAPCAGRRSGKGPARATDVFVVRRAPMRRVGVQTTWSALLQGRSRTMPKGTANYKGSRVASAAIQRPRCTTTITASPLVCAGCAESATQRFMSFRGT